MVQPLCSAQQGHTNRAHRAKRPTMSPADARSRWLVTAAAAGGTVLMVLGWYGISGRVTLGEQLPYLASGTIPGAALWIVAAVLHTANRGRDDATAARVAELHRLIIETASEPDDSASTQRSTSP